MHPVMEYVDEVMDSMTMTMGEMVDAGMNPEYPFVSRNPNSDGVSEEGVKFGVSGEDAQHFKEKYHDAIMNTVSLASPIDIPMDIQLIMSLSSGRIEQHYIVGCGTVMTVAFHFMMVGAMAERKRAEAQGV